MPPDGVYWPECMLKLCFKMHLRAVPNRKVPGPLAMGEAGQPGSLRLEPPIEFDRDHLHLRPIDYGRFDLV